MPKHSFKVRDRETRSPAGETPTLPCPEQVHWNSLLGAACLAGVGFTLSFFITMLAFDTPDLVATVKLAILGASLLAALSAFVVLKTSSRRG